MKKNLKKIETECKVCKAEFEIWVDSRELDAETEEKIRKNVSHNCPVCHACAGNN